MAKHGSTILGKRGTYLLTDQKKVDLEKHLQELGYSGASNIDIKDLPFVNIATSFWSGTAPNYMDNLNILKDEIEKNIPDNTFLVIDSFTGLENFCGFSNNRDALKSFIELFKKKGLTVILIWERNKLEDYHQIFYYTDGIISLYKWLDGDTLEQDTIGIKIDKLRGIKHNRTFFEMHIERGAGSPKFTFSVGTPKVNKLGGCVDKWIR